MMVKRIKLVLILFSIIIIGVLFSFTSCHRSSKKVDPFYTNRGDWDDFEIPLIKPYFLISLNGTKQWGLNLDREHVENSFAFSINGIEKINIVDKTILIYNTGVLPFDKGIKGDERWVVIIPSKRIEKGFAKHSDYIAYLRQIGFKNEPKLHDMSAVEEAANNCDIIDWAKIN